MDDNLGKNASPAADPVETGPAPEDLSVGAPRQRLVRKLREAALGMDSPERANLTFVAAELLDVFYAQADILRRDLARPTTTAERRWPGQVNALVGLAREVHRLVRLGREFDGPGRPAP